MSTASALRKVPISFLSPSRFIPVLPPIEASTCASRVVGMLMKLMPRLNVEAQKPPRSQGMPPPRFTSSALRVAPWLLRNCHTCVAVSMFLAVSPCSMVMMLRGRMASMPSSALAQCLNEPRSVSTNICAGSYPAVSRARSSLKLLAAATLQLAAIVCMSVGYVCSLVLFWQAASQGACALWPSRLRGPLWGTVPGRGR